MALNFQSTILFFQKFFRYHPCPYCLEPRKSLFYQDLGFILRICDFHQKKILENLHDLKKRQSILKLHYQKEKAHHLHEPTFSFKRYNPPLFLNLLLDKREGKPLPSLLL